MSDQKKTGRGGLLTKISELFKARSDSRDTREIDSRGVDIGYLPSRLCPTVALDRVSTDVDRGRLNRRRQ